MLTVHPQRERSPLWCLQLPMAHLRMGCREEAANMDPLGPESCLRDQLAFSHLYRSHYVEESTHVSSKGRVERGPRTLLSTWDGGSEGCWGKRAGWQGKPTQIPRIFLRGRQVGHGMCGGWNGRFWGAPIVGQNPGKHSIFPHKDAKSGRPKNGSSYLVRIGSGGWDGWW